MKRILSLLSIMAIGLASVAQTSYGAMTATNGLALDTVTNTATKNLFIGTTGKAKFDGSASFVLTVTKISGTVGGTATLQGSNNGTDWAGIATAYTVTDATQTKSFDFDRSKYLYYRINVAGTGTMAASIKGNYLSKAAPAN
jgi:hypothetical protein